MSYSEQKQQQTKNYHIYVVEIDKKKKTVFCVTVSQYAGNRNAK